MIPDAVLGDVASPDTNTSPDVGPSDVSFPDVSFPDVGAPDSGSNDAGAMCSIGGNYLLEFVPGESDPNCGLVPLKPFQCELIHQRSGSGVDVTCTGAPLVGDVANTCVTTQPECNCEFNEGGISFVLELSNGGACATADLGGFPLQCVFSATAL